MKAISLWQPWASAMAVGSKLNETRHWSTKYRGPLVIHAAKRMVKDEMICTACSWRWCAALSPLGVAMGDDTPLWDRLPFGALIAIGNLVDVVRTEDITLGEIETMRYRPDDKVKNTGWNERLMGNYDLERFAWRFEDIRPLPEPIPFKGGQGFFNVPDELLASIDLAPYQSQNALFTESRLPEREGGSDDEH